MAILLSELIDEILLALPPKSLKCVCKSFYAIIESKYFIYRHLSSSSEKRLHRKLISKRMGKNDHSEIIAYDINNGSLKKLRSDFEFPYTTFVASCNGLVLLYAFGSSIYSVWNPSTRKYRELPAFSFESPTSSYHLGLNCGFGYDSTTDDYKIFKIFFTKPCYQIWIFGLRSSCWREIKKIPYIDNTKIGRITVTSCCGYVYMLGDDMIVAFDVAEETYSVVPQPSYEIQGGYYKSLNVFEGCLFVMISSENKADMYVRKKEGVEFTWTKLLSIVEREFYPTTLGYSKGGDKVLFLESGNIYPYHLKERRLEKTEIKDTLMGSRRNSFCVESLLSPFY